MVGSVSRGATLSFASIQQRKQQQQLLLHFQLQRLQHCCVSINMNTAGHIVHSSACTVPSRSMSSIQQSTIRRHHQCQHLHHRHHPRQWQSQQSHYQPHQQHRIHLPITTTAIISTSQQRRSKVFVSRHNQTLNLSTQSITSFILAHLPHLNPSSSSSSSSSSGDDFCITSSHVILKECPFCSKSTNGKMDNMYKLYISIGCGAYFCHRCGCKGSWYDFKNELSGGFIHESSPSSSSSVSSSGSSTCKAKVNGNADAGFVSNNMNPQNSQQLQDSRNNHHHHHHHHHSIPSPLPMPPKKLNSVYITKLFDPTNSPTVNPKEYQALKYLTDV